MLINNVNLKKNLPKAKHAVAAIEKVHTNILS